MKLCPTPYWSKKQISKSGKRPDLPSSLPSTPKPIVGSCAALEHFSKAFSQDPQSPHPGPMYMFLGGRLPLMEAEQREGNPAPESLGRPFMLNFTVMTMS